MTAAPVVQVQLLGSFAMSLGEKTAGPWPRTSAKRLVELVFLSPKRRISKDVASDTLFRDFAPRAAANALHNALSAARAVLAGLGDGAAGILCTDRTHIYVPEDAPVVVDLELHECALGTALQMPPGDGRDAALVEVLCEQRELLEDEAYSDWALRRRESVELARQEARLALARDRSAGFGRPGSEAVISAWESYAARDAASEEAAVALMGAYAAQGQRHLVSRAYRRCCDGLRELGLEPSASLQHAYQTTSQELTLLATPYSADVVELTSNLPTFLSSFVGRGTEQAVVGSLVRSWRLVTLTGAGGSGKTRLAVEVAAQLAEEGTRGTCFVELAPVSGPGQVPAAVARAFRVVEQPGRPLVNVLTEALGGQDLLIVMDNCEHVIGAAAELVEVLHRSCPRVRVLVTSREPLGIGGEHVYRLAPLSLPAEGAKSLEDLEGSDAVKLFVERARSRDGTFCVEEPVAGLVGSICRTLDGIPLALELAAARIPGISLTELEERLDRRFRLLTGGSRTARPRQRTLQATFDWSFELLSPAEQVVLMGLSVFSGSFELGAAEAVCLPEAAGTGEVADLVGSLVDKSLVVTERSSGSLRYSLLETVRQYAADQLVRKGGEGATLGARRAHATHYLEVVEEAAPELVGPEQGRWMKRLDLDWDNLRSALYYLSAEGEDEEVLRLGAALWRFFATRGHVEVVAPLRAALERADKVPDSLRGQAVFAASVLVGLLQGLHSRREMHVAVELADQAVVIARRCSDLWLLAESLAQGCFLAAFDGDSGLAVTLGEESLALARDIGDPVLLGHALQYLALARRDLDPGLARELFAAAVAECRRAGDLFFLLMALNNRSVLEWGAGFPAGARALTEEMIALAEEVGCRWWLPIHWEVLGEVLLLEGDADNAVPFLRRALVDGRRGDPRAVLDALQGLARYSAAVGDYARAAQLTGAFDALHAAAAADAPALFHRLPAWALAEWEEHRERLRAVVGDEELERCLELGGRMRLEQACDLGLGRTMPG